MRIKFYSKKHHAEGVENAGFLKKELLDRFLYLHSQFLDIDRIVWRWIGDRYPGNRTESS